MYCYDCYFSQIEVDFLEMQAKMQIFKGDYKIEKNKQTIKQSKQKEEEKYYLEIRHLI